MEGFIIGKNDEYAVIPFGKKWMIIYKGQQLEVVNTVLQAKKYIKKHCASPETGTVFD